MTFDRRLESVFRELVEEGWPALDRENPPALRQGFPVIDPVVVSNQQPLAFPSKSLKVRLQLATAFGSGLLPTFGPVLDLQFAFAFCHRASLLALFPSALASAFPTLFATLVLAASVAALDHQFVPTLCHCVSS